ncbi:MAG: cell wall metabolism sensor histidine kinase WalK [Chitinophagaceae bacterium]|jgi:two-component system phosphate regulon sensor histidine kinase PhoR|nr:cell wall metabolism sensor histidine kinase WalK [Chitinophagaceae bacterium]MCU0404502.1 cell wall metabolism sensor histidine kinase WalK [Chitinophagaceae bacterium]
MFTFTFRISPFKRAGYMLETKNLTPQQLSLFTALILTIPVSAGVFILRQEWWIVVVCSVLFAAMSYALILSTLQKFIYRKIKLIYKFIYQTKASRREETYYKYILPQKSIDEVREDVEKWAEQRQGEIEMLKANEAFRKEFLQNLAHELKTPIFAIQGYVDTLLEGASENPEIRQRFLSKADRNIDRLVNLVNDLDEISKLESGELPLYKENFIIHEVIRDVFESLSIKSQAKKIKCSFKKGTEQSEWVFADKEKIRQVLINLVDNAIKYSNENGNIVASVYNTDGKRVLVEISDDGIGISEEHIGRIFERFYRTDLARSRKVGGSGLGLSICKHIIEAHSQTIHVRSKIDIGTTIGFTLDRRKE